MILGLDIGSSSVKAAVLRGSDPVGKIARVKFQTRLLGPRVEVDPRQILGGIGRAIHSLGKRARQVDAVALSVMAPAWVAMNKRGGAITPIVTHQDRRSWAEAMEIENAIGPDRHLAIAGVRPVPGGISSTTWAWFHKHHTSLMKRADLVGHLNTFLIRQWTGQRVVDPSNASFMGVFESISLNGWSDELRDNVEMPRHVLPEILDSNQIAGKLTRAAASTLGLTAGVPAFAGMIDTSAAMLLAGAKVGQLLNTCGSTDVLALLTDRPRPDARRITRAFGIGRKWMSVSTLAAAGSAIAWARDQLFPDLSWPKFNRLASELARSRRVSTVHCDPYLAGDRMSIEQPNASFTGLTLATTRRDLLRALLDSLATASAARLPLLAESGTPMLRRVLVTGRGFDQILRRDWPGKWTFKSEEEASLRGLGVGSAA